MCAEKDSVSMPILWCVNIFNLSFLSEILIFIKLNRIQEHRRIHTGEKPFTCEHCASTFRTMSSYYSHLKKIHGCLPINHTHLFPCQNLNLPSLCIHRHFRVSPKQRGANPRNTHVVSKLHYSWRRAKNITSKLSESNVSRWKLNFFIENS